MKVLFTSPILEHPAAGGPQLRIENSIKALSNVCEQYVVSRVPRYLMGNLDAELFFRNYCADFLYSPSVAGLSKNRYMRTLQKIRRRIMSVDDARFIVDFVDKKHIDVIWFGYGNLSFPLIQKIKRIRPGLKVVCDTDSVFSRFILRELPYESNPNRRAEIERRGKEKEREERAWTNLCEITTAVSDVDAAYYKEIANDPERIQIFSNVIDLESYTNPPPPPADFRKPCIYLAGTFGHINSPMDRAARWVLDEILPKVRSEIPQIHFYIVGRGTEATLSAVRDPNVTITGKLPSVLPYLCHADVALVPLQFESGTRFKILEAGACGIPTVSTTLGAEGIPVRDGHDILLADNGDLFARSIVRLIRNRDLAKDIANNCRELVRKLYSVESLSLEAKDLLQRLSS